MSAQEFAEWAAFERAFGPLTVQERVDVAGAVAGWAALKAAGANDARPQDLLPDWSGERTREQTDDEMIAVLRNIQESFAKKDDDTT